MSEPRWPPPRLPTPAALRLVSRTPGLRVAPPCGLRAWSDAAEGDLALVLAGPPTLADIASQLPPAATLPEGTLVLVLGELAPTRAFLGRWLRGKELAPRSLRTSALLALGYTRLGGGVDPASGHDLAWGYARSG